MFLLAGIPLLHLADTMEIFTRILMYLTNKQQTAQAQSIIRKDLSNTGNWTSDTQFVLNEVQKGDEGTI